MVFYCCFDLHGSLHNLLLLDHAFLLLCVISVDSIKVCHDIRRSTEMAFVSSSPSVMMSSANGWDSLCVAQDEIGDSAHMASHYIRSRRMDFKER